MTSQQFHNFKQSNPHLTFSKINSKMIFDEQSYYETHTIFNVKQRDTFMKSNGKTCYVEFLLKQISIPRNMVCMPKNFTHYWIIKKQYIEEITKNNNLSIIDKTY